MKHNDLQTHLANAVLSPEEKSALRAELLRYMRSGEADHSLFSVTTVWYSLRLVAGAFASMVLVAGGVSYAAESALPGDLLYPVKVEGSERLRTWAAVSEEAQAEWSVVRTTRRLEELERLATAGDLNETLREEITIRIERNTEEASKAITLLKKERIAAAAGSSSRLESSLRVHERMLTQVAEERADMSSQIHVILDMVRKKAASVSEIRQEIEKEIAFTDSSVDEKLQAEATTTPEELPEVATSVAEESELENNTEIVVPPVENTAQ